MKQLRLGYALSSEEHTAPQLVRYGALAEKTGFSFAMVSDRYHPWTHAQGNSPFVWSVLGGLSQATKVMSLATGVTCPTIRIHPTTIAQAAATTASLLEGRFMLGLGSGENINEHIFIVEHAQVFSLPKTLPPILVAASGAGSAALAGEYADGLITESPDRKVIEVFNETGGRRKPKYGKLTVCYAPSEAEAVKIAHASWPNAALPQRLNQERRMPEDFEDAAATVRPEDVAAAVVCGPSAKKHLAAINEYASAGFDNVYIHQVGPHQEDFFAFYEKQILPEFK
ncbi:LLM class flavin-dependent oxidoreductase [Candidatus Microgenomates bacterium]|nr:LLM class flavin-dependent oxidoreductase [Candidatus Microgenomates bacterium]